MSYSISEEIYKKVKKAASKPIIIKEYPTGVELAKTFNLSKSTIYKILKTKSYDEYKMHDIKRRLYWELEDNKTDAQRAKQEIEDFNNEWFFGGEDVSK